MILNGGSANTKPLTTILLGVAWTSFFGYLVWRMIDRIEVV